MTTRIKRGVTTFVALPYPMPAYYTEQVKELGGNIAYYRKVMEKEQSAASITDYKRAVRELNKFEEATRYSIGVPTSRPSLVRPL